MDRRGDVRRTAVRVGAGVLLGCCACDDGAPDRLAPWERPTVAVDDRFETEEDVALRIEAPGVLANDSPRTVTARLLDGPDSGVLTLADDGAVDFLADTDLHGTVRFSYAADGAAGSSFAEVEIVVRPVNDAPLAADDHTGNSDLNLGPIDLCILENDADPDGDPLTIRIVTPPRFGTVSVLPLPATWSCSGAEYVVYRPGVTEEPVPDDSFEYQATDGAELSNVARVVLDYYDPA